MDEIDREFPSPLALWGKRRGVFLKLFACVEKGPE
jgi:hypothetical protein